MKLLLDMNLSPALAELLLGKGIDAVHWYAIGKHDADDSEIMAYARNNGYIVLTCDLDFSAILSASHGSKPSVVQLRKNLIQAEQVVDLLTDVLLQNAEDLMKGAILSIDIKKARLRLLPL
jgi:predicted nuclease of predicted toxin-antitoxin system